MRNRIRLGLERLDSRDLPSADPLLDPPPGDDPTGETGETSESLDTNAANGSVTLHFKQLRSVGGDFPAMQNIHVTVNSGSLVLFNDIIQVSALATEAEINQAVVAALHAEGVNAYLTNNNVVIEGTAGQPVTFVGVNVTNWQGVQQAHMITLLHRAGMVRVESQGVPMVIN